MNKPNLSFYTNIPTPYQLDFFDALAECFNLTLILFSEIENNRQWTLKKDAKLYSTIVLKNSAIIRPILRYIPSFHFSWSIFKTAWQDKSENCIVGGNYFSPNFVIALFILRLKRKKRKITFFTEPISVNRYKWQYLLKWCLLLQVKIQCNSIFAIGKNAVDSYNYYGIKNEKIIIPYNIDVSKFDKNNLDNSVIKQLKSDLGIEQDTIVLLSSGSLIPRKGFETVISAFKKLNRKDVKLLILGDGELKLALQEQAKNNSQIIFLGFKEKKDIPYYFALSDIFVFASHYDGWAVVINEAIAANLIIVASDKVGAAIELITDGENGYLFDSQSSDMLASKLENLLNKNDERLRIKQNTQALLERVSSSACAAKVLEYFTKTP